MSIYVLMPPKSSKTLFVLIMEKTLLVFTQVLTLKVQDYNDWIWMAVDISPQQKYYRKLVNYSLRFSFLGDKVRAMQHIQNHIETEVYKYAKDEFEATIKGRRWRHLVCTHVMHTCGLITLLIPEFLFTKGPTTHPDDNHLPTLEAAGTTKHNLSAEELVKKLKLHNEVFVHTQ